MPSFKSWWEKSYTQVSKRLLLHALFWLAYLSFLSSTAYEHLRLNSGQPVPLSLLIWLAPVHLIPVYYFFIHTAYRAFQKGNVWKALGMLVFSIALYPNLDVLFTWLQAGKIVGAGVPTKLVIEDFASFYTRTTLSWFGFFHAVFAFAIYLLLPVLCKFFRDLQRTQQQFRELRERNALLELNLIKSQVNPHFLLNTLNNIYGISIAGSRQQIGEMILNLSRFLKYSLYECNSDFVQLGKEIRLIESYIELEQVRSDFINVEFNVEADSENYYIPPFLLFPLLENAFKHGTKNLTASTTIVVDLAVKDGQLRFNIGNDFQDAASGEGGFGLPALRKKIDHYYPGSSQLESRIVNGRYIAQLQIHGLCRTLPA